ncbi:MAG: zinc ribbon domain-containing protein [Xanthomonadales bacterium]|nr:zinc ribbon domain-containing protein [Xanthomonadales bacterium]
MAIMDCPSCGKDISSKARLCTYCGHELGDVTEEDRELFRARRLRDRIYRLNMISYAVIAVFLAGFGWYWWASRGFTQASEAGPFILMGATALAYLSVRAFLFRARQQRKAMRAARQMSRDLRRNL